MPEPVYILGGAQTDFARKWAADSGDPLRDMLDEVVHAALAQSDIDPMEIGTAHVGNFVAERFTGQSHLGAMICMLDRAWSRLPTSRHEGACASGSVATLAAMADLEAGRYDLALVVGVELMRNVPGHEAAEHLGCAAWVPKETSSAMLPWPSLFDRIADEVERRYGLDNAYLSRIAQVNRANARRNPRAQTRDWIYDPEQFSLTNDSVNPIVTGRTRASDCGRITDGASALLLANGRFVERWTQRRVPSAAPISRILGWGHHSSPLPLEEKFSFSGEEGHLFPNVRDAITDAYSRAGVGGPEQLDVIELHDCFTITEYVALDHFGLAEPGRAWQVIEDGGIDLDGSLPVNPSGGLIGAGHPVGATGVRMLLDAHRQVTGTAGDYQVPGAATAATLNIGGSFSTAVSFVVGRGKV